ncbi:carboxymuconolactone decarboxylase family protein [Hyperthermus butylicus]|uniref:carboxymuconolactone decarboxylase family protein n=1 Tax=Hyperthermus butylicus TaxID=54248 RepID=UPI002260D61D|nr:carboxymuconolactone decarboxylase family protein [Hyperthermus butylicus]
MVLHVREALRSGAKPEEVREAGWVAVLMCGGPCFAYLKVLEEALDSLAKS